MFFCQHWRRCCSEEPANFYPRDLLLGLATDYENNSYFNVKPVGRARGGRAGRAGRIGYVLLGLLGVDWKICGGYAMSRKHHVVERCWTCRWLCFSECAAFDLTFFSYHRWRRRTKIPCYLPRAWYGHGLSFECASNNTMWMFHYISLSTITTWGLHGACIEHSLRCLLCGIYWSLVRCMGPHSRCSWSDLFALCPEMGEGTHLSRNIYPLVN